MKSVGCLHPHSSGCKEGPEETGAAFPQGIGHEPAVPSEGRHELGAGQRIGKIAPAAAGSQKLHAEVRKPFQQERTGSGLHGGQRGGKTGGTGSAYDDLERIGGVWKTVHNGENYTAGGAGFQTKSGKETCKKRKWIYIYQYQITGQGR